MILLWVLETFFYALTKTFSILHLFFIFTSIPSLLMEFGPFLHNPFGLTYVPATQEHVADF